ncbi:MAG: hypothetical protein V1861_03785 [Candidatus Micrarchaeota archaeon]
MGGCKSRSVRDTSDSIGKRQERDRPGASRLSGFKMEPEDIAYLKGGFLNNQASDAFRAVSCIVLEGNAMKKGWVPTVSESRAIGKLLIEANEVDAILPSIRTKAATTVFFGYYLSDPHIEFKALEQEFGKTNVTGAMVSVSRLLGRWCREYWGRMTGPLLSPRRTYHLQPMSEGQLMRLAKSPNLPSNWAPSVPASRAIAGVLARAGETCILESQMGTPVMKEMLAGYFLSEPPIPFNDFSKKFGRPSCQGAIVMISRRLGKWYREYLKKQTPANDNSQD